MRVRAISSGGHFEFKVSGSEVRATISSFADFDDVRACKVNACSGIVCVDTLVLTTSTIGRARNVLVAGRVFVGSIGVQQRCDG